ncbi:MAG: hypothetical protein R2881_05815 [Eubacteriales bacterium]
MCSLRSSVLAITLPGKPAQADQGEQLAAFAALDTEQTALENATLDGMQPDGLHGRWHIGHKHR